MRAVIRIGILALISSAVAATDAVAALGWLEKLSGPGPFKGPQYALTLACYGWPGPLSKAREVSLRAGEAAQTQAAESALLPLWRCHEIDPNQMRVDLGVDMARLSTNENPLMYAAGQQKPGVRAFLFVPYVSVSVAVGLEAGVGFGLVRFTDRQSDEVDTNSRVDFSSTKALIQPIRLTVKPLAPFFDSTKWDFLQFAFNGTLILQTVRDRDFGAVPGTFREPTEMLWQCELRIDLGHLLLPGQTRSRRR
jgi:hypothetical protein